MTDAEALMRVGVGMFARTLPITLLTYGLVWWIMRPKESSRFSLFEHGICFSLAWVSAVLANILFAPDGRALVQGHDSPAMILMPASVSALVFYFFKRRRDSTPFTSQISSSNKFHDDKRVRDSVAAVTISPSNDEWMYERVAQEIDSGNVRKGLWTKLWVESGGDERLTRLAYTKQRVLELSSTTVCDERGAEIADTGLERHSGVEPVVFRTLSERTAEPQNDDPCGFKRRKREAILRREAEAEIAISEWVPHSPEVVAEDSASPALIEELVEALVVETEAEKEARWLQDIESRVRERKGADEPVLDLIQAMHRERFELTSRDLDRIDELSVSDTAVQSFIAMRNGDEKRFLELLRTERFLVELYNQQGDTLLHLAIKSNRPEFVQCLLKAGSSKLRNNLAGESPLSLASRSSNRKIRQCFSVG